MAMVAHVEEVHTTGSEPEVCVFAKREPRTRAHDKNIRKQETILLSRCRMHEKLDADETNFFLFRL